MDTSISQEQAATVIRFEVRVMKLSGYIPRLHGRGLLSTHHIVFDPEGGGSVFFRNSFSLQYYTVSQLRRYNLNTHRCENPKISYVAYVKCRNI
jgi:hypothetical protein